MWRWAQRYRVWFVAALYAVGFAVLLWHPDERGRLLMFFAGIFLYESKRAGWLDTRPHPANQVGAIVVLALAFYIYFGLNTSPLLWSGPRLITVGFNPFLLTIPLFCCAFFYLCFQAFRPSGFLPRIFSWKPLRYLGNMSYTVYLFHVLALEGVRYCAYRWTPPRGDQPGLFLFYCLLGAAAVWLLSTLVFAVVEKPISLTKKPTPATPTQPAL
jgi:peptidoglycan/LPS O-acetylase OafA/YrhL